MPLRLGPPALARSGLEETRRALVEARRSGILSFCLTTVVTARDDLPHAYRRASWALIDDVRRPPLKASDICRRLTS